MGSCAPVECCVPHVACCRQTLPPLKSPAACMAYDLTEHALVVGTESGMLRVYDLHTLRGVQRYTLADCAASSLFLLLDRLLGTCRKFCAQKSSGGCHSCCAAPRPRRVFRHRREGHVREGEAHGDVIAVFETRASPACYSLYLQAAVGFPLQDGAHEHELQRRRSCNDCIRA
jgi:hypothetical protein